MVNKFAYEFGKQLGGNPLKPMEPPVPMVPQLAASTPNIAAPQQPAPAPVNSPSNAPPPKPFNISPVSRLAQQKNIPISQAYKLLQLKGLR